MKFNRLSNSKLILMEIRHLSFRRLFWITLLCLLGFFYLRGNKKKEFDETLLTHGNGRVELSDDGKVMSNREIDELLGLHPVTEIGNMIQDYEAENMVAPPAEKKPTPIPYPEGANALPNFYLYDGERATYQAAVPAFVHVARCAGSTMNACFNKTMLYYGNKTPKILDLESRKLLETLLKNAKINSKAYRLYSGKYTFGICQKIPDRDCGYITILRDPYDRIVSAYYACRESEGDSGYALDCHTTPIEEWVIPISSIYLESFFTLLNCLPTVDKENWFIPRYSCDFNLPNMNNYAVFSANEHLVQHVLDNMDKTFALIGLTEDITMTLQLLQNSFNIPFYEECKELLENQGTFADTAIKSQAKQTLMSNTQVQQALSGDVRVYEKAKEIFEKQKQKLAAMFS